MSLNLITTGSGANTTPIDATFDQLTCNDISVVNGIELKGNIDIDGTLTVDLTTTLTQDVDCLANLEVASNTTTQTLDVSGDSILGGNLKLEPTNGWIQTLGASFPSTSGVTPLTLNYFTGVAQFDVLASLVAGTETTLTIQNSKVDAGSVNIPFVQIGEYTGATNSAVIIKSVSHGANAINIELINPTSTDTGANWTLEILFQVFVPSV